jgi:hypothetical protein
MTQLPIYYFSPLPYAVGSKGFVEHVKSALGALAKGRKAKGSGDSYQLQCPQRLIKQIAWPDPGLKIKLFNIVNNVPQFVLVFFKPLPIYRLNKKLIDSIESVRNAIKQFIV